MNTDNFGKLAATQIPGYVSSSVVSPFLGDPTGTAFFIRFLVNNECFTLTQKLTLQQAERLEDDGLNPVKTVEESMILKALDVINSAPSTSKV